MNQNWKITDAITSLFSTLILCSHFPLHPLQVDTPSSFSSWLSVICLYVLLYFFGPVSCRHWPGALSSHRRALSVHHQLLWERNQQAWLWFTWDTEVMWLPSSPHFLFQQHEKERKTEEQGETLKIPLITYPSHGTGLFPGCFFYLQYTVTSCRTVLDWFGWFLKGTKGHFVLCILIPCCAST